MESFGRKGRLEDARMLTGSGRYVSDWNLPGQARGHFLRSDRPHARIVSIDASAALAMPGVIAVLTGKDVLAAGHKPMPAAAPMKGRGGSDQRVPPRYSLTPDCVRYVGEPVALIVAETAAQAQDAAEAVVVDYEELPAGARGAGGACRRRAATARLRAGQPRAGLRRRRRGGDQGRVRARGQGRHAFGLPLARGGQSDGAARRDGQLRRESRLLHAACDHAGRGTHATAGGRDGRRAAGEDAHRRRGSGRRIRRALQRLPGVRGALPRRENAGAAREVGRQPRGGVHRRRAGARHRAQGRARAGCERAHAGDALRVLFQCRGLPRVHRLLHQHREPRQRGERRVRRAGGVRAGEDRAHQHRADGRLPRRGAPGRLLRHGAPGGPGRAGAGPRPGRVPPPQPGAEVEVSLQDRHRLRIRLRRLRRGARQGARTCRLEWF